jgi:hypothetical protein
MQSNATDIWTLVSTFLTGGAAAAIIARLLPSAKEKAETEKIRLETKKLSTELKLKELTPAPNDSLAPKRWLKAGSHPDDYDMSIDQGEIFHGKKSCYIKSRKSPQGFGTLMQMFKANSYLGKRVKLVGYARSEGIEEWAGFWMRVDGPAGPLKFDNMQDRPIRGTTGWTKYQTILDVPDDSKYVAFGLLLGGAGQVWMADLTFEIVPQTVPTTDLVSDADYPDGPLNLSFDE